MNNFIYVFNAEARDKLLAAGMTLLKADARNKTFIFLNEPVKNFSMTNALSEVSFIEKNELTF